MHHKGLEPYHTCCSTWLTQICSLVELCEDSPDVDRSRLHLASNRKEESSVLLLLRTIPATSEELEGKLLPPLPFLCTLKQSAVHFSLLLSILSLLLSLPPSSLALSLSLSLSPSSLPSLPLSLPPSPLSLPPSVFRPGSSGLYWYVVISGSLEMLDVNPSDSSKVSSTFNQCKV